MRALWTEHEAELMRHDVQQKADHTEYDGSFYYNKITQINIW